MPNLVVGTVTPVKIPVDSNSPAVIQNLGAGIVYVDGSPTVSTSTGLKVGVGVMVTIDSPNDVGLLYVISDTANTNVRYLA